MRCLQLLLLLWSPLACCQQQGGADIAGVHFAESVTIGTAAAQLNGAGLRSLFGIKAYAIGIYLPQRIDRLEAILRQPGAKRIQIVNLFDLSADILAVTLAKGMRRNLSEAEFAELRERIDLLRAAVHATGKAASGSLIQLDWLPAGSGHGGVTRLSVNALPRGEDIPGEDFYQALLKVWLGEKVNDARLRDALLGRAQ